jgi:hypothetical protein
VGNCERYILVLVISPTTSSHLTNVCKSGNTDTYTMPHILVQPYDYQSCEHSYHLATEILYVHAETISYICTDTYCRNMTTARGN